MRHVLLPVILLQFVYVVEQFDRFLYTSARIPFIDYHGTEFSTLVGPLFTLVYTFSAIFIGFLADTQNRVLSLAFMLAGWSCTVALVSVTRDFSQVAWSRAALGVFQAGCTPFAVSILSDIYDVEQRGSALGWYNTGIYMGYSLSLSVGTILCDTLGWKLTYLVSGAIGLILALILTLAMDEPPRRVARFDSYTTFDQVARYWARSPTLILLCLAGGIRNACGYVWGNYTSLFFSPLYSIAPASQCSTSYPTGCTADYPYCIQSTCRQLEATPWHNVGMDHGTLEAFMSWIPLVAGSCGVLFGGIIADLHVKRSGPTGRISVLIISTLIAAPFAFAVLYADFPYCFLLLIPMNMIGEMFVGICLTLVVEIVPATMRTSSIAIYMFIITNIGGNVPVLIPIIANTFPDQSLTTFTVKAGDQTFNIVQPGAEPLRWALTWLFPTLYLISAGLFMFLYCSIQRDVSPPSSYHRPLLGSRL